MTEKIFCDCRIYILQYGLLKKRIELFANQILNYGGKIVSDPSVIHPTHIIIEDRFLLNPVEVVNALKSVNLLFESINCEIVSTLWLSKCLKEKKLLDTSTFSFLNKEVLKDRKTEISKNETPIKMRKIESDHVIIKKEVCNMPNEYLTSNEIIITELQKLADAYRARGDRWRSLAYDKAIQSLKTCRNRITDINEVRSLPHISAKMFDKISEILENGFLGKTEAIYNDEKTQILDTFNKLWGVGPVTAQMWYKKGLRTLDDLVSKGNLTPSQKIALKYYDEIQEPVSRKEIEEIMDVIKTTALQIEPSLQFIPCGSFRRGKEMCGDIDVLLIAKDSTNYRSTLPKIIDALKLNGFLMDDLVGSANSNSCLKYLGLGKLRHKDAKMRRIDIFVAPESESACATMHYTGSGLFNRAIRLHASKMNMHLNQFALTTVVPQKRVLPTPTEESIFELLGLPYRPPENREIF